MAIRKPLVIGMGRVGSLITLLLSELGMQVVGVDMNKEPAIPVNVEFVSADVTDPRKLARLCRGRDALIVCLPYHLISGVAQVAHTRGIHYFRSDGGYGHDPSHPDAGRLGQRGHDSAKWSCPGLHRYARGVSSTAVRSRDP